MADELDDLYRARPEDFTGLRTRLAAAAKERGEPARARQISASRKPTIAAWVVNRLALSGKEGKQRLVDLGERLRAAHAAMDGEQFGSCPRSNASSFTNWPEPLSTRPI